MYSCEAGLVVITKQRPVSLLTHDKSHWPTAAGFRLMLLGNKLSFLQNAVLYITFSKTGGNLQFVQSTSIIIYGYEK